MKKNGFKSKRDWIRWAIERQLDVTEKAVKKIEGTAIDESGIPSIPEYKEEKEYTFILHDGDERRGKGTSVHEAWIQAGIKHYEDILDFHEV